MFFLAAGMFILGFTDPADELPSLFWSIVLGLGVGTVMLFFALYCLCYRVTIALNQESRHMVVRWRYLPFFGRIKRISKNDMGTVVVRAVQKPVHDQYGTRIGTETWYHPGMALISGKEIMLPADKDRSGPERLVERIREFQRS
jgi:hypothetical protein